MKSAACYVQCDEFRRIRFLNVTQKNLFAIKPKLLIFLAHFRFRIKRSARARCLPDRKAASVRERSARERTDSAARNDSRSARRSDSEPCLRWFAAALLFRYRAPKVSALISEVLAYKDV